ncbi:hypothetical protein Tco_0203088, partial [Tanacetum coccineum]
MRAEHTLEQKGEVEDNCAEQTALLSERDAEIVHLKSLKEAEATEAISFRRQLSVVEDADVAKGIELRDLKEKKFAFEGEKNVLSERVETLESVIASKDVELASLSSQDCLATQKISLESALELFKEQVEKMQDEQMELHMDAEFYPRYLTTIAGRRWILSRELKLVLAKCLS